MYQYTEGTWKSCWLVFFFWSCQDDTDVDEDFSFLEPLDLITKDVYELRKIIREKKKKLQKDRDKEKDLDREPEAERSRAREKDRIEREKEHEKERERKEKDKEQQKQREDQKEKEMATDEEGRDNMKPEENGASTGE